jgi:hypothetical protein
MTLFQHTLKQLLTGQKTETSRLALPEPDGTSCKGTEMIQYPNGTKSVMRGADMRWFPKWQVGKDYAIQPNRGVKAVGRYRIEDIWWQDVRSLSNAQVQAEGFASYDDFMRLWIRMHGTDKFEAWRMEISVLWDTVNWEAPAVLALEIDHHQELIKALNTPVR